MISRPILLGSTGLALLLSGVAFAMPQVPVIPLDIKPGQTYVTIDAQYSGVPEDDFKFFNTCPFDGKNSDSVNTFSGKGWQHCDKEDKKPFLDASHSIDAYGGGGIIGVAGSNPWFGGNGQRFELGFGIIGGDRTDHRSELFETREVPAPEAASLYEGGECNSDGFSRGCYQNRHIGIEATAKTDYDAYNIVGRTLIDFEVSSNITITPNFGFVYRHTENTVHAIASWIDQESSPAELSLSSGGYFNKWLPERDERVRTNEIGVELGTTISFDLSDAFRLFGGVNGEILYREGRFNRQGKKLQPGGECGGGGGGLGLSSPSGCDPSLTSVGMGGGYGGPIRDEVNDTAYNLTLSLGASWRFRGGTTLSVIGYAQNEDHLVVVNDKHQQSEQPMLTSSYGGGHGAHLESERDWTPGVVVALTVPFGGS